MSRLSRSNTKLAQARPFAGMSQLQAYAAGVDIGAHEIMVCIPGEGNTQVVRAFGNYTLDLQAIGAWLQEEGIQTIATPAPTAGAVWKVRGCIGSHSLKSWNGAGSIVA